MFRILVPLIFLLQGIPVQQGGKVTGVLRDNMGNPLEGVRIAAVSRGGTIEDAALGNAMAGLAQTDQQGRFTLEDIPPGRYSIAAGRLDLQTYFPGTQALGAATILTVVAGETITGINFVLDNTSFGRSTNSLGGAPRITATIPVRVTTEKGGKVPVSAGGKLISLRLESSQGVLEIPIDGLSFTVPGPVATDFRVAVQALPDAYEVKSISYGSTVIPQGIFRLTAANFPTVAAAPTPVVAVNIPQPSTGPATEAELRALLELTARLGQAGTAQPQPAPQPNASPAPANFQAAFDAAVAAYRQALSTANTQILVAGSQFSIINNSLKPAATPPSSLSITLAEVAKPPVNGVRVSGQTGSRDNRRVYLSGRPGTVFSDGTFEVRDVPPGRHLIAATGNAKASAAVVVVGDKDVAGIQLTDTLLLPDDVRDPKDPAPAGGLAPGTVVPLARVRGTVVEEISKAPITEGEVIVRSGDSSRRLPIDSNGRFETFMLLPGTYDLRLQIFGHATLGPTVVVEDKDITLEVPSRRLY